MGPGSGGLEPPFDDPWPTFPIHREFPSVVAVGCGFCGAPPGASCIGPAGKAVLRNHPRRVAALVAKRLADRLEAERIAAVYPARGVEQTGRGEW